MAICHIGFQISLRIRISGTLQTGNFQRIFETSIISTVSRMAASNILFQISLRIRTHGRLQLDNFSKSFRFYFNFDSEQNRGLPYTFSDSFRNSYIWETWDLQLSKEFLIILIISTLSRLAANHIPFQISLETRTSGTLQTGKIPRSFRN